jgi:hypothetical protein
MFVKKFRENGTLTPVGAITRGGVVYHIRLDALPQKQPWRLKRKPWRTDGESTGATAAPVVQVASPSRLVQTATSTGANGDIDWCKTRQRNKEESSPNHQGNGKPALPSLNLFPFQKTDDTRRSKYAGPISADERRARNNARAVMDAHPEWDLDGYRSSDEERANADGIIALGKTALKLPN